MSRDQGQGQPNTRIWILQGDSAQRLAQFPPNSFDSLVTDPPAGVDFMGKDWDNFRRTHNPNDVGRDNVFGRTSRTSPASGAEGEARAFIAAVGGVFREALRVLKPGAHGVVWALPRTAHWTATALEEVGFEIRDRIHDLAGADDALTQFAASLDDEQRDALVRILESQSSPILHHLFLNGMPKGQGDVRRVLDMHFCALPGKHGDKNLPAERNRKPNDHICPPSDHPLALARQGFATGLKPTVEHWILVRKRLEGTQARNQVRWGTGAMNIEGTRVPLAPGETGDELNGGTYSGGTRNRLAGDDRDEVSAGMYGTSGRLDPEDFEAPEGRWPRHAVLTHNAACQPERCVLGCPVALLDAQAGDPEDPASVLFNTFQRDVVYVPKASVTEKEAGLSGDGKLMDGGRVEGSLGGNNPRNRGAKKRKNTHPCLPPGELVLTEDGWREIQTLTPGVMVYTNAGKYEAIADVSSHVLGDDRIFRIRVDGDKRSTRATGNHPFLVWVPERRGRSIQGGSVRWVSAEDIQTNYYLMTPVWAQESEWTEYSADYWWAAGLWLAEGSIIRSGDCQYPAFSLHEAESDFVRRLRQVWANVKTYRKDEHGMLAVAFGPEAREAAQHFLRIFGSGARTKHLSPEVLSLPVEGLRSLLDGYVAGDGALIHNRHRVKTASNRLASDLFLALPRVGCRYSSYWYEGDPERTIMGRRVRDNGHWHIYIGDPGKDKHKTKPLFVQHDGRRYFLRRVSSIVQEPYSGLVWNLTMAESPTFQTVVGMSHNTVKPVALMRHLVRLVTPPGGVVLDPYVGSGTTLIAAHLEGMHGVGIEREAEYVEIAKARLAEARSGR